MTQLGKYLALYVVMCISLLFLENDYRWLTIVIIIPFTLLWALFLGYDVRNLAIAMPILSVVSGIGLVTMLEWFYNKILLPILHKLPRFLILVVIGLLLVTTNFLFSKEKLVDTQTSLQKQIFSKTLDESLYAYFGEKDLSKVRMITNYPVAYLPGFKHSQEKFFFNDVSVLNSLMQDPAIGYLLVPVNASIAVQEYLQSKLEAGDIKFVFDDSAWIGYSFYEIMH
jgi:hypothetical protein